MNFLSKMVIFLALFLVIPSSSAWSQDTKPLPTVKEVTNKLDDLYRSKSSHSIVTMTVINDRGTRKLTMEQWTIGKDDALILIRKPAREAGTATLKTKEGLWNYAPRADRLIRVPTGLLSDAWMGSHFSNDDLIRETSYEVDYKTSLSWIEDGGKTFLVATMTPRPKAPVIYDKIEFRLLPDSWTPVRADYYDRGKLMRQMVFEDLRDIDGRIMPMLMTLLPKDKPGEKTEMRYESVEFDIKVKKDLFTKRGLRQAAKKR